MTFYDKPFTARFNRMGDEAEQVFEKVYKNGWVRTGLNRPPIRMASLPPIVRYMPDYLTSKGWVEVQGCGNGRDTFVRFKHDKMFALREREKNEQHPVYIFVYNKTTHQWAMLPLEEVMVFYDKEGHQGFFQNDGNTYFTVPFDTFDWKNVDTADKN